MFGIFGKPDLENSSFNNALIASLGDYINSKNRFPTESELLETVTKLTKNYKITVAQINATRACALSINNFSWADSELTPLLKRMRTEIPTGDISSYEKIVQLLARYGIIMTDEAISFMKKHGL